MKRKLFLIFVYMACFVPVMYSQDIIMKTDGTEIQAKVTDVNTDEVRYRVFKNPTGPVFVIAGAEIFMIKYENGSKDIFKNNPIQIQHVEGTNSNKSVPNNIVVDESRTDNVGKVEEPEPPVVVQNTVVVQNVESPYSAGVTDDNNLLPAGNNAILHFYRSSMMGLAIKYDLYLNDVFLFKVSNKWKETVQVSQYGLNTLWAKTEARTELPINIEPGGEYYIRCSVKMGVGIGRPNFELVDNRTGEKEFRAIAWKKGQNETPKVIQNPTAVQNSVVVQNPVAVQNPVVQTPVAVQNPVVQNPVAVQNVESPEPAGNEPKLTPKQDETTKKWGYVDESGKETVPCIYDNAFDFSVEGYAIVQLKPKGLGIIDKTGREVIPCKYQNIYTSIHRDGTGKITKITIFFDNLLIVQSNYKWGYIDITGRELIPCIYQVALEFSEDLAAVMLNDKWGFIDKSGQEVIPFIYDAIWSGFSNGKAKVMLNSKNFYIDKAGNTVK